MLLYQQLGTYGVQSRVPNADRVGTKLRRIARHQIDWHSHTRPTRTIRRASSTRKVAHNGNTNAIRSFPVLDSPTSEGRLLSIVSFVPNGRQLILRAWLPHVVFHSMPSSSLISVNNASDSFYTISSGTQISVLFLLIPVPLEIIAPAAADFAAQLRFQFVAVGFVIFLRADVGFYLRADCSKSPSSSFS